MTTVYGIITLVYIVGIGLMVQGCFNALTMSYGDDDSKDLCFWTAAK